jgi:hypothetical protein
MADKVLSNTISYNHIKLYICNPVKNDLVAQPVEQLTLNQLKQLKITSNSYFKAFS